LAFNKPAVVAVSRHTFNDLARLSCYDGLPASWAYNGVDYNFYEVAVDQSRYFLYVGNAEGHKDLPTLLKACTSVFSERPEVSMVLAGKIAVDRRHELLRVVPNGFRSRVHFRGYVGEDELKRLYRRAVAVVIPGSEGFGLSAAEALMAGRPPLVPTGSAQAEISGPLGIQYASGNPSELASRMLAVLVDQEDFSIQEARHVYAQRMFSWDQHAQHLVGVMSAVVGRSK
jgi:glycosyltransferase involved in cell wall biosynthesis